MTATDLSKTQKAALSPEAQNLLQESERKLKENPRDYSEMYRYARLLSNARDYRKSAQVFMDLIKLGPEQAEVYESSAEVFVNAGQHDNAVFALMKGLEKFPLKASMLMLLANVLILKKDYEKAFELFDIARGSDPDNLSVHISMGVAKVKCGRFDEAIGIFEKALEIDDKSPALYNSLGTAYMTMKDHVKASEYFLKAAKLDPTFTIALINLGSCFEAMGEPELAIRFYDEVIAQNSGNDVALCAKASLMCTLGMPEEAIPLYRSGLRLMSQNYFKKDNEYLTHLSNFIFYIHYAPGIDRKEIRDVINVWHKSLCADLPEKKPEFFENIPDKNKKLRIGLISAGFNVHPVGQMIYRALENMDREKCEFYCYSEVVEKKKDYLTKKIYAKCEKVVDVFGRNNIEVVDIIRNDQIDILLEMNGHSEGGRRLPITAMRVAPVQVKWVGGLFDTTGIPQMDWLLADKVEVPEGDEKWYSEKIYRMPDDYIVYMPPHYSPGVKPLPALDNGYVTFGNLNNLSKINSFSIDLWVRILQAVPKSRLLMKGRKFDTPMVKRRLEDIFAKYKIGIDRLLIEGGEGHKDFMNVYNRIDIALDPHPYTGGLTTCEALWMGVPVITLPGETFAGRHAATHLTTAGMADWIAEDEEDYINIAKKRASDIDALAELRSGLRNKVSASPLVDGPRFAQNLEIALRHMWSEWCDLKSGANQTSKNFRLVKPPKPKKGKKKSRRKK